MSSGFPFSVFFFLVFIMCPHNLPDYKQAENEKYLALFLFYRNGDVIIWLLDIVIYVANM